MYIILAIIFFGVLIAIHEFGHFSAAKLLSGGGNGPVLLAIRREKGYDGRQKTGSPLARAERRPARS